MSGGIAVCGECGKYLQHVHRKHNKKEGVFYNYYRCPSTQEKTAGRSYRNGKGRRAEELEEQVWEFVSSLLKNPELLSRGLGRLIEQEKSSLRGDPEKEAKVWLEQLSAIERKRSGFQEIAAEGLMSLSELKDKLTQLNEEREAAEEALEALRLQRDRFEALERDAEALLTSYAGMVPEKLGDLSPEERQRVYRMLRLEVSVCVDGGTKISSVLVPKENFYVENISSPPDKTGKERTTPLLYLEDSGNYAIVASNGGDPKSPAWLLNLETNPEAAIEVGSKKLRVRVEEAEGEEKRRLWRRLVAMYPSYESYQRRTDREIPIVVLRPAKDNEPK